MSISANGAQVVIAEAALQTLLDALRAAGYTLVGPTMREGAIVYDEIAQLSDLPRGWSDEQEGGTYRLKQRADDALFGYVVGPHSWKKFLYPPAQRLWQAQRAGSEFQIIPENDAAPAYAFIGVRPCELHAIAIQDKIFMQGAYADPSYAARRDKLFVVAVNCGQAGGTCFCVSMHTGPKATSGFDLALTEIWEGGAHEFVVEIGSARGAEVMREVPHHEPSAQELQTAQDISAQTAQHMGRTLDTSDLKALLYRHSDHPRWDDVANRCLTCGNCTMVCPTCFCATVQDVTDLTGEHAERWRKWDSCFTMDFSYIHGGSVRATPRARYRQWLTHKLATWVDQFDTFGCVGCGRCITWCPVAIDLTAEVRAIQETDKEHHYGNA
jgi:sulfhydrogenase subunit beta (sulfur reductase)